MVVGLIFFLTFLEIPDKNKDLITSIIGMLVGSISMAISIFVGRDPDDIASLKAEIAELNDDRTTLIARLRDAQIDKDILRRQHEGLQALVISKLSVFAEDKRLGELAALADERSIPEEVARWIPGERAPQIPATMTPLPKRSPLDDILGGEDKS